LLRRGKEFSLSGFRSARRDSPLDFFFLPPVFGLFWSRRENDVPSPSPRVLSDGVLCFLTPSFPRSSSTNVVPVRVRLDRSLNYTMAIAFPFLSFFSFSGGQGRSLSLRGENFKPFPSPFPTKIRRGEFVVLASLFSLPSPPLPNRQR